MDISVIVSTYNAPAWLEKVLWGYCCQSYRDFEIVIADDGSRNETRELIERMKVETGLSIRHVWHPDDGFQKCVIMNKAIIAARGEYLVFSDGDCIPRGDFLQQHADHRRMGSFLSGGYSKLSYELSHRIGKKEILDGELFDPDYLHQHGLKKKWTAKHCAGGVFANFMNWLTPTTPSWNGHNASTWKSDILSVNGFDERMVYGGEDREFGERLVNKGLKPRQIRYSAICVHLDHERGYVTREGIDFNKSVRSETKKNRTTWTNYGIDKNHAT